MTRTAKTPRSSRRGELASVRGLLAALVAAYAALSLSGLQKAWLPGSGAHWVTGALLGAAGVMCVLRGIAVRGQRVAWVVAGGGLLSWGAGELMFAGAPSLFSGPLSLPNVLSLAFYPCACVAIMALLRARVEALFTTLWLDGLAGALSVCALVAAFLFPPVLAHLDRGTLNVVGAVSYPLGDLLLVASGLFAMAMTGWRPGRVLAMAVVAFSIVAVTDSFSLWWAATGHSAAEGHLQWLWAVAALVLVEVAWRPARPTPPINNASLRLLLFPVAVSLTALGLLLSGLVHSLELAGYELAVSALVLIVVRLALTVLENIQLADSSKREALTDALTGLGNRRKLMLDVEAALESGDSTVLALFDLDGFKGYNDTFGHPAGDSLLTRLGRALDAAVAGGAAYRLGGDEFCVLLPVPGSDLPERIAAAVKALSEHGKGFVVAPSYGSVVIPSEASDVSAAFQLADQRLYGQKGERRRAREGEQVRDALIQALRERRPDLDEHLGGVARLAHAVARRLGMNATEVEEVTRAAELHDIGKMAVPDAILEKPAGLDEAETELIRQHTIIGERILAVSPALRRVGALVRHSHERYDGHGYPDGLVGEEIPLGSRIIAACDAFDAMTSDRPYQPAVPVEDALAELRRCAGGQFDPVVVHAFCVEAESLLMARSREPAEEVFEEAWTLAPPAELLPDGVEAVDQGQHDGAGH
jgi:diguanylate cyclase (GGDEF)-like protein/putative nucleotidyltransferase with HDIG domain